MSTSFPIPYPGQLPSDDLATARLMLNSVTLHMEDGAYMDSSKVQCLFSVLCAATEKLEILQLYLDDYNCPDEETQYQATRRLWVMQRGGAA